MQDKSYIRQVANQIRSRFSHSDLPNKGLDELFDSYAVLALNKGLGVTNEDVHNAWSAWATKYDSDNSSLVPFDDLPNKIKEQDTPFTQAIKEVAKSLD